jgi:hypothetical protein
MNETNIEQAHRIDEAGRGDQHHSQRQFATVLARHPRPTRALQPTARKPGGPPGVPAYEQLRTRRLKPRLDCAPRGG